MSNFQNHPVSIVSLTHAFECHGGIFHFLFTGMRECWEKNNSGDKS